MLSFITRFRFLPITICAAVLMLFAKLGSIAGDVDNMMSDIFTVGDAKAQQPTKKGGPKGLPGVQPGPAKLPTALPGVAPSVIPGGPVGTPGAPGAATGVQPGGSLAGSGPGVVPPGAATLLSKDPTLLTQAEIDLLQQLADRREQIEGRTRELDLREGLLKAAENRIGKKIQEMKALQVTIKSLIKKHDTEQDAKLNSLVKIYQNMKPKDAARIFEELELEVLLMVAERMRERKLAAIMAKMNPVKARELTIELSKLRKLPNPASGLPNS
ncbi:MAG: MotE family protein [Rhodospirillales bacterium]|jgi:flagellar motility protein MotE (MotC chaperone)